MLKLLGGDAASETHLASSVVVGGAGTESTATVTLEGNDGASALASAETAALRGAVLVLGAGAGDELSSGRDSRGAGGRSGSGSSSGGSSTASRSGGWAGDATSEAHLPGSVVVGSATEAAATVTLEGDDGAGALAGVEATAALGTIVVTGARAGDELGALAGDGEGEGKRDDGGGELHFDWLVGFGEKDWKS